MSSAGDSDIELSLFSSLERVKIKKICHFYRPEEKPFQSGSQNARDMISDPPPSLSLSPFLGPLLS